MGTRLPPQATATATPVGTPSTERPTAWPIALAVNPNTKRVYVATADDDAVVVMDGANNTIVATISVAVTP